MNFKDYLIKYQPLVYQTFVNEKKYNRVSQALLIKGNDGAPVFECAKFFAKSLICQEDELCCNKCLSCIRFDEGNYADLRILDASKNAIKVSDIDDLQAFIASYSMETANKKIYIINLLENCNKETVNALLKTLEEPTNNTYAFITTQNESKLLPTIISRCQVFNLLPLDSKMIVQEALDHGVNKIDAELLSPLYSSLDTIMEMSTSDIFIKCKNIVRETMEALDKSKQEALFFVENIATYQIKSKEEVRLYLDLLTIYFKDLMYLQMHQDIVLNEEKELLTSISKKIPDFQKYYLELMLTRGKIELNVSIPLILEHIFIYLIKGGK
jgi:DNA polymerase-3 subunit delta'